MKILAVHFTWRNGAWEPKTYPYRTYYFRQPKDSKREYREEFGLVGKHNVEFYMYDDLCGVWPI